MQTSFVKLCSLVTSWLWRNMLGDRARVMGAFHQLIHSFRKIQHAETLEAPLWELKERLSGIFPTCEEGMVMEAFLLVLMRADIK